MNSVQKDESAINFSKLFVDTVIDQIRGLNTSEGGEQPEKLEWEGRVLEAMKKQSKKSEAEPSIYAKTPPSPQDLLFKHKSASDEVVNILMKRYNEDPKSITEEGYKDKIYSYHRLKVEQTEIFEFMFPAIGGAICLIGGGAAVALGLGAIAVLLLSIPFGLPAAPLIVPVIIWTLYGVGAGVGCVAVDAAWRQIYCNYKLVGISKQIKELEQQLGIAPNNMELSNYKFRDPRGTKGERFMNPVFTGEPGDTPDKSPDGPGMERP